MLYLGSVSLQPHLHREEQPGGGDVGDVAREGGEEDGGQEAVLR